MLELNTIHCADCLSFMKDIPDGSIDLCWFDPPYNVGKKYPWWNDSLPDDEYLTYCEKWANEAKRVSGNKCAILVPTKYKLDWWNILGRDYREIQLTYGPSGAIRYGFSNQFSTILVNVVPKEHTRNVWHNCQMSALGWFFRENTWGHPGYTSEDITKRVIYAFSLLGDTILDPFLGSGTTAVAALKTGRNFIGIEIDPKYCAIAQKRVDAELAQTRLAI